MNTDKYALFYDTETTGLPNWNEPSESEGQPHIVQLAALLVDVGTKKVIQSMDVIVQPDGWEIPKEVTDIHNITTEYATQVGIPEPVALQVFLKMWAVSGFRIAHNQTFDARIIRIATKRYCDESVIDAWKAGAYKCTGLLAKPIMKMLPKGKFGYKMPKLSEAYQHFTGKEIQDAHTAMADARACMDIFFAIDGVACLDELIAMEKELT
jgi:DNA polymerase III subunit epsilon